METEFIRNNIQAIMKDIRAVPVGNEHDMYMVKHKDCTIYINYSFDTVPMPVVIFNVWRATAELQIVNLDVLNDLNNKTTLGTHSVHKNVYFFRHAMWLTDETIINADTITNILSMAQQEALHGYDRLKSSSVAD